MTDRRQRNRLSWSKHQGRRPCPFAQRRTNDPEHNTNQNRISRDRIWLGRESLDRLNCRGRPRGFSLLLAILVNEL